MKEIVIETRLAEQLIDITHHVAEMVADSGVTDGVVQLWCCHTTAGLTINENADPDVKTDILLALNRIVPDNLAYRHGEGNSPAHVKSSLMGCSLAIPVADGQMVLGTWQGIMFCEFDGPRSARKIVVSVR